MTEESRVDIQTAKSKLLNASAVRQVYLVTYSQANLELFPTRRLFAEAVAGSFYSSNTRVSSRESHRNGGFHYQLDRCRRWLCSKKFLKEQHSISEHFQIYTTTTTVHGNTSLKKTNMS